MARLVATLPAPLVTVLATPVATLSTVDAIPVPTEAAPEVMTEKMEESCAEARGAATSGRRMAKERMVMWGGDVRCKCGGARWVLCGG